MGKSRAIRLDERRIRIEKGLSDRMAIRYDQLVSAYDYLYRAALEKVKTMVENNHTVLEVGCGTGIISLGIADRAGSLVAVDISPKMIAVAQEKALRLSVANIEFHVADAYDLPYEDNHFDGLILFNILHILKEPGALLAEAYRVLKPNGYLIVAADCYKEPLDSFSVKILILVYRVLKGVGMTYLNRFRKADLINLLKATGIEITEVDLISAAPANYYVLGRKRGLS